MKTLRSPVALALSFRDLSKGVDYFDKLEAAVAFMLLVVIGREGYTPDELDEFIESLVYRIRVNAPVFLAAKDRDLQSVVKGHMSINN